MDTRTKLSINKKTNQALNILVAKLGMKKSDFFEALTKAPMRELRELLAKEEVKDEQS